jgi:predicted TIM-barrel fold metal-dependent hydrolase
VLDAVARDPARVRGVALVPTDVSDAALRALHGGGIRGVRFNFIKHLRETPDTDAVLRLAERIAPLGWHVQLHFGAEDLLAQRGFLQALQSPFAIDHMGRTMVAGGLHQEACLALLDLLPDARAWIKLSGPERISAVLATGGDVPYGDVIPFARQLLAAAPERAVWGTDWPHPNVREMPDDGDLVDLLAHYGDAASLQRLLVDNPARLYGFH